MLTPNKSLVWDSSLRSFAPQLNRYILKTQDSYGKLPKLQ
jgi:hypothetical protein